MLSQIDLIFIGLLKVTICKQSFIAVYVCMSVLFVHPLIQSCFQIEKCFMIAMQFHAALLGTLRDHFQKKKVFLAQYEKSHTYFLSSSESAWIDFFHTKLQCGFLRDSM